MYESRNMSVAALVSDVTCSGLYERAVFNDAQNYYSRERKFSH